MKTLYITDLDGTLLDSNAQLSAYSKENLNKLIAKGMMFTVATARTNATVIQMFSGVELTLPFILMNGVLIYDPIENRNISAFDISKSDADSILNVYSNHGKYPMLYFLREGYLEIVYKTLDNEYQKEYVSARNNLKYKKFTECKTELSISDTDKLIYIVSLDKSDILSPIYNEIVAENKVTCAFYSDNYTDCNFMECMNKSVSKGVAALEVKRILGVDRIVAFGDNLNDIPLFEIADECYAVSNACNELKAVATGVIDSNENDGVVRFLIDKFNKNES